MKFFSEIFIEWNKIFSDKGNQSQARFKDATCVLKENIFVDKYFTACKHKMRLIGKMNYW